MAAEESLKEPLIDIEAILQNRPPMEASKLFSLQQANTNAPAPPQPMAPPSSSAFRRIDTSEFLPPIFKRSDSLMSC